MPKLTTQWSSNMNDSRLINRAGRADHSSPPQRLTSRWLPCLNFVINKDKYEFRRCLYSNSWKFKIKFHTPRKCEAARWRRSKTGPNPLRVSRSLASEPCVPHSSYQINFWALKNWFPESTCSNDTESSCFDTDSCWSRKLATPPLTAIVKFCEPPRVSLH